MVREFKLINEKGQEYSLMDIENHCLLTEPSGLGIEYSTEYTMLGNRFFEYIRHVEKGEIKGVANFLKYDNYKSFVDFIENSVTLKLSYKIPFETRQKEYFRDILIQFVGKTEKQTNGVISENIIFDCLSLWYEQLIATYTIEKIDNEIQWDFWWDSRFSDYSSRSIVVKNDGHTDAEILVEFSGPIINPGIYIHKDKEEVEGITIPIILAENERLLYSSQDKDTFIRKENENGTKESLFKSQYIDINNNNIFKIPKGTYEVELRAENDIQKAKLYVYKYYKVV